MNEKIIGEIRQSIQGADRILIISHIRPDGDAIGSLLGLGLALETSGKEVQMLLADGVPANFHTLKGSERIVKKTSGNFDLIIVVDCAELKRIGDGSNSDLAKTIRPDINIDHHITNQQFGRINLVVMEAASTSEIIAELLPHLGIQISPSIGDALLTGLVTDTLGFRTPSTHANSLRIAADLMDAGANLYNCYFDSLIRRSYEAALYWGAGLSGLERNGRMVWGTLRLADRKAVRYPGRDDADLINVISSIDGADISLIFVEQTDGRVKISWRSQPGFDVSQVAQQFGGGGHAAAAGADVYGNLEEIKQTVLEATRQMLK